MARPKRQPPNPTSQGVTRAPVLAKKKRVTAAKLKAPKDEAPVHLLPPQADDFWVSLPDDATQKIATKAGLVTLPGIDWKRDREGLSRVIAQFLYQVNLYELRATGEKIRKWLNDINDTASQLRGLLSIGPDGQKNAAKIRSYLSAVHVKHPEIRLSPDLWRRAGAVSDKDHEAIFFEMISRKGSPEGDAANRADEIARGKGLLTILPAALRFLEEVAEAKAPEIPPGRRGKAPGEDGLFFDLFVRYREITGTMVVIGNGQDSSTHPSVLSWFRASLLAGADCVVANSRNECTTGISRLRELADPQKQADSTLEDKISRAKKHLKSRDKADKKGSPWNLP